MSIIQGLETTQDFTSVDQVIAQYVLGHVDEVIHVSIKELAIATNSSNAAIIRLCKKLGLSGFKALKVELIKDMERRRNQHHTVNIDYPVSSQESSQDTLKRIAELTIESVNSTYEVLDHQVMDEVSKILLEARIIYIYAIGDSLMTGMAFANRLIKLKKHTIMMTQYGEIEAHIRSMEAQDAFILVSYTGKSTMQTQYLRKIQLSKAKRIVISASNLQEGFHYTLKFPARESMTKKLSTYYSQISMAYIFNCLYALMYTKIAHQEQETILFDEH